MMKKSMTKYYTPWFNRYTQVRDIWIDLPRVWRTRTRHIRVYIKQCGTWFRAILGDNHFNHLCGKVSRRFLLYTHLNIALLARLVAWLLKKGWCSFRVDDTLEGVGGLKILTLDEMKVHCTLYILTTQETHGCMKIFLDELHTKLKLWELSG